jgi:hypothetical protein
MLGRFQGEHHVLRHILQTERDVELTVVAVVEGLDEPENRRYHEKKEKNQELPVLLAEEEVPDFLIAFNAEKPYVLFAKHTARLDYFAFC